MEITRAGFFKTANPSKNRLLDALPRDEFERLLPHPQQISFSLGDVVYEFGGHLDYLYFPTTAIISLLYTMKTALPLKWDLTGNDGVVGIALFMWGGTMLRYTQVLITHRYRRPQFATGFTL